MEEVVAFAYLDSPITEANLGDGIFPAGQFLALSGSYGIGTDSNVLIDAAEELRVLEYTQRLALGARNVMADHDARSTGRSLFESALRGGSRALGTPNAGIRAQAAADLISLDSNHDALADRSGDAVLDGWIFAARHPAVDCVWRYGRKVVSGGRHVLRERIASGYRAAMKGILGSLNA
jgi:formimidoylglutamate deiminase